MSSGEIKREKVPEWMWNVMISYHAIDLQYTAVLEAKELERYGAEPVTVRRRKLTKNKQDMKEQAISDVMDTEELEISKVVWKDMYSAFSTAPIEEREEFFQPYITHLRKRINNLVNAMESTGRKVKKECIIPFGRRIFLFRPHSAELHEISTSVPTNMFGKKFVLVNSKNIKPVDPSDWFRVRLDDVILRNTTGLTTGEKNIIVSYVNYSM